MHTSTTWKVKAFSFQRCLHVTSHFVVENMSISNTHVSHSMEKSSIILLIVFFFFFKREKALQELLWQLGWWILSVKGEFESRSELLVTSDSSGCWLARWIKVYICERAQGVGRMWVKVCTPTRAHWGWVDQLYSLLSYHWSRNSFEMRAHLDAFSYVSPVCVVSTWVLIAHALSLYDDTQSMQEVLVSFFWPFLFWNSLHFFPPWK